MAGCSRKKFPTERSGSTNAVIVSGVEEEKGTQTAGGKEARQPWTLREYKGKPVWDWLDLLIVPIVLLLITVAFTVLQDARQQQIEDARALQAQRIEDQRAEAERELAEQRAQDEALQAYLNQMSTLLLEKDLRSSTEVNATEESQEARALARARTLTVLSRLDPSRKTALMQFLVEAGLVRGVGGRDPIIGLSGANLSGAGLGSADLSDADLRDGTLSGANLSGANLSGAGLGSADLSDANLRDGTLSGANLSGAHLTDANLNGATLSGADLSDATLSSADLGGAGLADADLSHATLMDAFLMDVNLRDATLRNAYLVNATLFNANLSNATLFNANLFNAKLSDANLGGADLAQADLREANLINTNLGGADLAQADLREATLSNATLSNATLFNANLSNAIGLTDEQLSAAKSLEGATMPDGQTLKGSIFTPEGPTFEDWLKSQGREEDGGEVPEGS